MANKYDIWTYYGGFGEIIDFTGYSMETVAKDHIETHDDEYGCLNSPKLIAIKPHDRTDMDWSVFEVGAEQSIDYHIRDFEPSSGNEEYADFLKCLKEDLNNDH